MDGQFALGLLHNIALLLASGVIFDHYWKQNEQNLTLFKKFQIGVLLSVVGIILMLTPWKLHEGLVFDGRSILLSIAGLFFGFVPAITAMTATVVFRLMVGGDGVWMGSMVIVTAGTIGILWNRYRPGWQDRPSRYLELALLGFVVHVVMLGCTFFLPESVRFSTLRVILWPTLIIYPLGSFLFGFFLLHRLKHWQTKEMLRANEERFRLFYENAPVAYHSLDRDGKIREVNLAWLQLLGYRREEVIGRWIGDFLHPAFLEFWTEKFRDFLSNGRVDNLDFSFLTKEGVEVKTVTYGRVAYNSKGEFLQTHSMIHNITERKRAEENIARLNERLTLAARAARFGVWDWDIQNDHLDWDDTMYDIYGLNPNDFKGAYDAWISAVHPDDMRRSNEVSLKAREEGTEYDTEFRILSKDGSERLIRALGLVIRDADGTPVRMTGINYDITQRRSDEERLRDALHQLEIIAYNLPNVLWKADVAPDGSFVNTYISPVVDEFLLLPPNTISHNWNNYFSYIKADYLPGVMQKFQYGLANQGETISMEYEINLADGSSAWFLSSGRAYTTGHTTRIFGYTTNITERKVTEQKIAESERLLRSYIEGAPDAIFIYGQRGRFALANLSAQVLTGYTADEFSEMRVADIISAESYEKARALLKDLDSGSQVSDEMTVIHKSGNQIPVIVSAVRVQDNKILAFIKDITPLKQTQAELIEAKEKAEESNRLKSAFLATMSHELRTPLNAIIGFSSLIEEETNIQTIYENAAIINRSGDHLLSIIESVFDMAMLQAGKESPILSLFKVKDLVADLAKMAQVDKVKKGKEYLNVGVAGHCLDDETMIRTDRGKLMQLLGNFLNNAIKYTLTGSVEIGFYRQNTDVSMYIKDTGIGIAADKHSIIFEQFRQADDSHTRVFGGVGLGLSICDEIARLLGGEITVDSEEGMGSTFWFHLSGVVVEQEVPVKGKTAAKGSSHLAGKSILLVDDVDDNLYLLNLMLTAAGAHVLTADSGRAAIGVIESEARVDVVLMDVKMPDMDGYEATRLIHEIRPLLPVVAQTAYAIAGDREEALSRGCAGYLSKPIKRETLYTVLEEVLKDTSR